MKTCDAECGKHGKCKGEVKSYRISAPWYPCVLEFDYCDEAVQNDREDGFTVEEINDTEEKWAQKLR